MRVLHVVPSLALSFGGPSQAMVGIAQVLSDRGVDCDVAACLGSEQAAVALRARPRVDGRGAVVVHCFTPSVRPYTLSIGLARWLIANVRRYDLVHVHGLFAFPPVFAAFIALCVRRPYVIRPFGVLNRYGLTRRRPWAKRISLALVEKPLLRRADQIHYTAEAERAQAEDSGVRGCSTVLPLGVAELAPGDRHLVANRFPTLRKAFVLVTIGRLDPIKNLEALIDAMAILAAAGSPARLLVCGEGKPDYQNRLFARAAAGPARDSIIWAGDVRGAMKASALAIADVFVQPTFSENFGNSVVEAMAAGKPVVVTEGVPMHDLIKRRGAGVVCGTDAPSLAAAMQSCIAGEIDLARAGAAGRRIVQQHFSLDALGDGLVALYRRLAIAQGAPSA